MGKRYKTGNVGRRKKIKYRDEYWKREQELNLKINKFMDYFYHRFEEDSFDCYNRMNQLRLDIKTLFDAQGSELHRINHKRRYVYYDQLSKFKNVYSRWKKKTYLLFIIVRYDVPVHLLPFLKYNLDMMKGDY